MVHTASTLRALNDDDVAVIITSHNYGKYLAEAIESVLRQTLPAAEIIVVDDASEDDTREVAMRYAPNGVRYLRGEWRASGYARNAGLSASTSPYLVFLDADDVLDADYLRHGIDVFHANNDVGIAYTDYRCFGDADHLYTRPEELNWQYFDTDGDLSVVSMLNREAVVQAGGWHLVDNLLLDWSLFREMFHLGWKAYKSKGLFLYRVHGNSQFYRLNQQYSYAQLVGFLDKPISILLSLSGEPEEWASARSFLERQTFPHERVHLFLLDFSGDSVFGRVVREWMTDSNYNQHSYFHTEIAAHGNARMEMLNTAIRMTTTATLWILCNTRELPADAYEKLASRFGRNVLSVSATCSGTCLLSGGRYCFCCHIIRGEFLRRTILREGSPHSRFEDNFFHDANLQQQYETVVEKIANDEVITVVTASDENYAIGLAAMGASLALNHTGKRKIELTILDGGITEKTKSELLASWEPYHMHVNWIEPDMSGIEHLALTLWFTQTMYLRLLIPELLPQSVKKALYLDSDIIVMSDIEDLWNVDLGEHPIAAVRDMKFPTFDRAFKTLKNLSSGPKTPYYHSGVLLMNVVQWREQMLATKIIDAIDQLREVIQWPDQDGINAVLADSCLPLDPHWNVSVQSFVHSWEQSVFDRETFAHLTTNPGIVHFATQFKPWHSECEHPQRYLFFEYLDKTRWKGWRPQRPIVETNATEGVLANTP